MINGIPVERYYDPSELQHYRDNIDSININVTLNIINSIADMSR